MNKIKISHSIKIEDIFIFLLLVGGVFFIPDFFVDRFKTGPHLYISIFLSIGTLVFFFK